MSSFKTRTDYFKRIAIRNKLIAHEGSVLTEDGGLRNAFFRINGEEELMAACESWIHFPCVAHIGYDVRFKDTGVGLPRRITSNHLYFLAKKDTDTFEKEPDAIEAAYDIAHDAMMQFISYMREDFEVNGSCGQFFLFNLNGAKAEMLDPINEKLYGWYLIFEDEKVATEMAFDSPNFFVQP